MSKIKYMLLSILAFAFSCASANQQKRCPEQKKHMCQLFVDVYVLVKDNDPKQTFVAPLMTYEDAASFRGSLGKGWAIQKIGLPLGYIKDICVVKRLTMKDMSVMATKQAGTK